MRLLWRQPPWRGRARSPRRTESERPRRQPGTCVAGFRGELRGCVRQLPRTSAPGWAVPHRSGRPARLLPVFAWRQPRSASRVGAPIGATDTNGLAVDVRMAALVMQ